MEDMDIDQVVEIPDTPDRPGARNINSGNFGGKERKLSVVGCLGNFDFKDEECLHQPRTRGRLINENGHNRRCNTHHLKNSVLKEENPRASQNASLFRRTTMGKNSNNETRNFIGAQHIDRGEQTGLKFPSKSSAFQKDRAMVDLPETNGHLRMLEMALQRGKMKDLPAKEIKEGQTTANGGSSHWPPNFPMKSGSSSKGKEKISYDNSSGADSYFGHEKVVDLCGGCRPNDEKQLSSACHSLVPPRGNRQKRLVRNGCISPHNIQIKAKQLAEHSQSCMKDVEQNHSVNAVFSGPCAVDISDIVAEDKDHCIPKGITMRPCTLKEHEPKIINLSNSLASNHGKVNGNGYVGGWRSTHNHSRKVDHLLPDSTGLHIGRNNDLDHQVANTVTKRQKKHESTSNNLGQSSRTISDDSDIVFLGSSGESSRSRSSRIQSRRHQGILDVDDFSPEIRNSDSQDSDAITRQLEADEMLALELQEQLYHESPVFGSGEIDENLARVLQQEEVGLHFSDRNNYGSPSRTSASSYRPPQTRLLQNVLSRRGARARVQSSAGVAQLRNRFLNRSRTTPSRGRNFQFPLEMDLDMRLDILEAFEAAFGEFDDAEAVGHVSQLHREFNENDYEMLLALDENNHQSGASANLINSLPLSTVQNDNFEEACAICLDTPSIGDSIRHLPCLHKFHKACIDPWLKRRPSCPVCKSSIT